VLQVADLPPPSVRREHRLLGDIVGDGATAQRPGQGDQARELGPVEVVEVDVCADRHGATSDGHYIGRIALHAL